MLNFYRLKIYCINTSSWNSYVTIEQLSVKRLNRKYICVLQTSISVWFYELKLKNDILNYMSLGEYFHGQLKISFVLSISIDGWSFISFETTEQYFCTSLTKNIITKNIRNHINRRDTSYNLSIYVIKRHKQFYLFKNKLVIYC